MVEAFESRDIKTSAQAFFQAQNLRESGNPEKALPFYDQATKLTRSRKQQLIYLQQKGVAQKEVGDFEGALKTFGEVEQGFIKLKHKEGHGNVLRDIAILWLAMDKPESALSAANVSRLMLWETKENPGGVALSMSVEARALTKLGEHEEAVKQFERALELARKALVKSKGKTWWPASTVPADYAKFLFGQGNYKEASRRAEEAIEATRKGIATDKRAFKKESRQDKRLAFLYLLASKSWEKQWKLDMAIIYRQKADFYLKNLNREARKEILDWFKNTV